MLAQRFLARYCAAQGLPLDSKAFSREALDLLMSYHWPGNIRELESTVSRAALSAPGRVDPRRRHRVPARARADRRRRRGDRLPSLAEAERAHIVRVLEAVQWNKKEAARVLDISRGTLYRKIVEYSLEPEPRSGGRRRPATTTPDVSPAAVDRPAEARMRCSGVSFVTAGFPGRRSCRLEVRPGQSMKDLPLAARLYVAAPFWPPARWSSRSSVPALLHVHSLGAVLRRSSSSRRSPPRFKVNLPLDDQRLDDVGVVRRRLRVAAAARRRRDDARRGDQRVEPVHVPDAGASARSTGRCSAWRRWWSR